ECIKPVEVKTPVPKKGLSKIKVSNDGSYMENSNYFNHTIMMIESNKHIYPIILSLKKYIKAKKIASLEYLLITLNDCLACSGCVTSAETVLVAMQSQEELYKVLKENRELSPERRKIIVVSVSPQSRASIAAKHGEGVRRAGKALDMFFKTLGAHMVLDTSFAREIALLKTAEEFMERYRNKNTEKSLPMLTSSCPGWICYAEKTHGDLTIPFISRVKSPQQITGSLVKKLVSSHMNTTPDQVYHVTVMPCYDKKLEASRQDFYDDIYSTRDVDLVLTSGEVAEMIARETTSLEDLLIKLEAARLDADNPIHHNGAGSGGYLDYVFKRSAQELFGRHVEEIVYKTARNNKDFRDVRLLDNDGKVLLHFAAAYGFRSIQNLVQKMKRGKSDYDFVEVMACPSGCLNGGGQVKSESGDREQQREILSLVEIAYNELPSSTPGENSAVNQTISDYDVETSKQLFHTRYHAVEKDESLSLNVKW
uniref:Iron hydrogenase large subunit C-terminal domain-containing protein n=1 Tax=Ciona savignyi TaxID=51511 RepID=H2YGI2_CIOSA